MAPKVDPVRYLFPDSLVKKNLACLKVLLLNESNEIYVLVRLRSQSLRGPWGLRSEARSPGLLVWDGFRPWMTGAAFLRIFSVSYGLHL